MAPFVDTETRGQKWPMWQTNETYLFLRLTDQKNSWKTLSLCCRFCGKLKNLQQTAGLERKKKKIWSRHLATKDREQLPKS